MTRRLLIRGVLLLILLSGGAIVNVAVAWGCAAWSPLSGQEDTSSEYPLLNYLTSESWAWRRRQGLGYDHYDGSKVLARFSEAKINEEYFGTTFSGVMPWDSPQVIHVGLPLRSFQSILLRDNELDDSLAAGWAIPDKFPIVKQPTFRRFPVQPLWPGFAINTIFYAAVLWVMFVVPFALRRRLRIRRGLCPVCAYPIGSSPVCTECGGAIVIRNEESK